MMDDTASVMMEWGCELWERRLKKKSKRKRQMNGESHNSWYPRMRNHIFSYTTFLPLIDSFNFFRFFFRSFPPLRFILVTFSFSYLLLLALIFLIAEINYEHLIAQRPRGRQQDHLRIFMGDIITCLNNNYLTEFKYICPSHMNKTPFEYTHNVVEIYIYIYR